MRIYVRTRGRPRAMDYQFLGAAPEEFWWRDYRPVTDIERPTIVVRSDGRSWQLYIAGIQSRRLDSTEITIQFNLAMAGDCGKADETDLALSVITQSAAGLAEEKALLIPGEPLDGQLPASEVERMLGLPGEETVAEAGNAVRAAYAPSSRTTVTGPAIGAGGTAPGEAGGAAHHDSPAGEGRASEGRASEDRASEGQPDADVAGGSWMGGAANSGAVAAFGILAARLLRGGQPGCAAALNLVEEDADLEGLPEWGGALGVLCARPGPHLEMAVRTVGKAGPPLAAGEGSTRTAGRHQRPPHPSPLRRKGTLILIGLSGLAMLAVLISLLVTTGVLSLTP